jgi:CspA family cold shock protein
MCGSAMHRFNDKKKVNTLCEKLQSVLWDKNIVLKEFQNTIEIIERALVTTNLSPHEAIRRKNFTVELISLASENVKAKEGRERGIVKWFDEDRGFGFIQNEKGKDFFVHYSAIWGTGYKSLAENQVVEFTSATSEKGLQAKDVEIVHA